MWDGVVCRDVWASFNHSLHHSDSAEPRFVFFVRIRSTIPILQVWILNIYLGTRSMSIILPICQVHHFEIPNLPRADWEILNLPRADWEIPNLPRADWEIPNLPKPPERIVPPGRLMLEDTLRRQSRRSARCSKMRACTHARTHACTHARMHARTHARMHACTHARMHARTHDVYPSGFAVW